MTERPEENPTPAVVADKVPPALAPARARWLAALLLAGCLALLGTAGWLQPDRRGYGTAEQLGTGPCGVLVMTGLPCPTCGMTTAFAYTVRGQWIRAFWAQPAGLVLAVGTMVLTVVCVWVLLRGRWPRLGLWFITPHRLFLALLVLLLGAWGAKIWMGLADGSLPYHAAAHALP